MADVATRPAAKRSPQGGADLIDDAVVLVVGFASAELGAAMRAAGDRPGHAPLVFEEMTTLEEAEAVLGSHPVAVLALGPGVEARATLGFLETMERRHSFQRPSIVVLGAGDLSPFQALVQDDRLFYLSREPLCDDATARLLVAALDDYREQLVLDLAASEHSQNPRARRRRRLLATAEELLQAADLEAVAEPALEALHELLEIDGGRLWLYDRGHHTLTAVDGSRLEVSAVAGLSSWVARTATPLRSTRPAVDPRHDRDADGEGGHFLAVPVLGPEGRVLGVLVARRAPDQPPFADADEDLARRVAEHLAPALVLHAPRTLDRRLRTSATGASPDIFRGEAVEASARGFSERGRVLRNTPGWTRWTWIVVLTGFVVALGFLLFGTMHEYARGPAVVRVGQRVDVTAHLAAAVTSVEIEPGEQVRAGQALARLYGAPEASEIENLEDEHDQRLRQRLVAPSDASVEASLIDVRTRLERARARLAERVVRSPSDGVVGDVRIRPGQHLVTGELLLSVIADPEARSVIGLVPGQFGPQLATGQVLRLTLRGYPDLALPLEVLSVGEEVIGPEEARQALSGSTGGAVSVAGPVVLVEARLPEASFHDGERSWAFRDGMHGTMEIRVRSKPILFHLVPGLERAVRGWRD